MADSMEQTEFTIPARGAHSSMEYVQKFQEFKKTAGATPETPSKEALARLIKSYRDPREHLQKIGQAMVAPILVKLKYEGVVRNILVETPLGKGEAPEYDVLDTLGVAYILNQSEGQVMVRRFEGKRVHVELFHVATFPVVGKDDIYALRADIVLENAPCSGDAVGGDGYMLETPSIVDYSLAARRAVKKSNVRTISREARPARVVAPQRLHAIHLAA